MHKSGKDKLTLGGFILYEMRRRDLSARAFAELVGVPHATINRYLNHGIRATYGGKPVGDPDIGFLVKLSKATGRDVCALIALTWPDAIQMDARTTLLAQELSELSETQRESLNTWAVGIAFKGLNKNE